jgi:hypothetical protein
MSRAMTRGQPADEQPEREQGDPEQEWAGQAAPIDQQPGDDDPEQVAEEEAREDPAIQVDAAEVLGDDRQDRPDGERLGRDDRDVQDEADRQRPPPRRPEPVVVVVAAARRGCVVHRVRMPCPPRSRRGRMSRRSRQWRR